MSYEDSDAGFQHYLRQIAQYPLLTPAQEITLAAKIRKGDKKAKEEMIRANLRLVVKIARDYANLGLPLMDLISEGNIGLVKAVERFDPAKGGSSPPTGLGGSSSRSRGLWPIRVRQSGSRFTWSIRSPRSAGSALP